MKKWTTPAIENLEINLTAQGTEQGCQDKYQMGSYNGPGSTADQQGICS